MQLFDVKLSSANKLHNNFDVHFLAILCKMDCKWKEKKKKNISLHDVNIYYMQLIRHAKISDSLGIT